MKIVIGLGNPGVEYKNTRHNIGWMFIKHLEEKYSFICYKKLCSSIVCKTKIAGKDIIFAKPTTYMNLSGDAVLKLKKFYKVENEDILIIYDDIDIDFGTIRYKKSGSAGTHNGMRDILNKLSTKDIPRIRIGIGGLKHEKQDLANFVLEKFSKEQTNKLNGIFEEAYIKFQEFLDK